MEWKNIWWIHGPGRELHLDPRVQGFSWQSTPTNGNRDAPLLILNPK
jgi:hypothetical protein